MEPRTSLPAKIIGPVDINHLSRELATFNETMLQLKIKQASPNDLPKVSHLLNELATTNKINLLTEDDRARLTNYLNNLGSKAPVVHISFSVEPSTVFLEKLVSWLRREIAPDLLVTVGLQPNIGVGCVIRTTNRYFDLSLKQSFAAKRAELAKSLIPESLITANLPGAQP
jgi:F0F1-type ATP synthase delta subunit